MDELALRGRRRSGRVPPAPPRGPARPRRRRDGGGALRLVGERQGGGRARPRLRLRALQEPRRLSARVARRGRGVDRETGRVRLRARRVGDRQRRGVNPDGIRNQTEGGILQSMSWTLLESGDLRRHAHHEHRLGDLSDPALRQRAGQRRGARHRPARPAVPRHRRGGAGPDRRGDRQRDRATRSACASATCR